ncbi:Spore protein SP21 [bacterium HR29]|jgi:HSP20 family protein|nr:Spore protein SP21 [bacterium HR29]
MRYRRLTYTYTVTTSLPPWETFARPSVPPTHAWRPDADVFETREAYTVIVDLAGVTEDEVELLLYPNALVVQGARRPPRQEADGVYHVAGIRYGPFRLEVGFASAVVAERVTAHLERGMLRIELPKVGGAR